MPAITVSGGGSLPSGDTAAFTESYDTPAVGTGKTLILSGSVNDGNGGADYSVTLVLQHGRRDHADGRSFRGHQPVPASITAGNNFFLVVTAEDAGGNVVTSYGGTVSFTSSDPLEPHPAANFTFTPGSGVAYVAGHPGDGRLLDRHRQPTRRTRRSRAPAPR